MGLFEQKEYKSRLNFRQKVVVAVVDAAILVELCVGMFAATANPDAFTPTFMKTFFTLFVPTLVLGVFGTRLLRDRPQRSES
jgi:uncharacterized Tic20 family protein